MVQWAVVITAERYAAERLVRHDTLSVADPAPGSPPVVGSTGSRPVVRAAGSPPVVSSGSRPVAGDEVLVVAAGDRPAVVALGRVVADEPLRVAYTRRAFEAPVPADEVPVDGPVSPVDAATFRALADRLAPAADRRTWLVSVDLPIEAESPAEAVRLFWSYVTELGPAQLPAFVSPSGDELAMQAFVLGEPANLDPEEDD